MPPKHNPDAVIAGLKLDGVEVLLFADGFVPVHEEPDLLVFTCIHFFVYLEIWHSNQKITNIVCFSKNEKDYVPLTLGQLQKFIVEARTKRQNTFLNN